ncbi:MAG: hypothetical protein HDR29_08905, partial [Lachnospiraceae bacterium]|nr:hypothetical protein [Lachnospiraceae bacterium]
VSAKEDSGCTGSQEISFKIDKAASPTIAKYNIYTAAGDADNQNKNNRTLNLSKRFNVSTTLNEEGVEPIKYTYSSHIPGNVLADENDSGESSIPSVTPVYAESKEPWGESTGELLYYVLNYSVTADADDKSGTATIVLDAEFENYETAQVTIEVSVKEKTELRFGMEKPSNKKYDGEAYSYDIDNVYVVDENGEKLDKSDDIMAEIESDIRLRYVGETWIGKNAVKYDSYEAPVKRGNYYILVEILESNENYKAAENVSMIGNNFQITGRSIIIKADPINIYVGDPLPERYTYTYLEQDLMDGDRIVSEPRLSCTISNTDTAGQYVIRVSDDGVTVLNSDGDDVSYYYSVEVKNAWLTVSEKEVTKKQITLSEKTNANTKKTYDKTGFNGASLIDVKDGGDSVTDAMINIRYIGRGDTEYPISSVAPVNVGTYTIKAKVDTSDDKYTSNEVSIDIEIEKAEAPVLTEKVINEEFVDVDTQKTLDITQCLPDGYSAASYGNVVTVDESSILTGTQQVDSDGMLLYTLKAGAASGTATLTIPLEFKNYENTSLTVKIVLTSKTLLTLSQAAGVEVNKEYDGSAYTLPENVVTVQGLQEGAAKPNLKYVYTYRGSTESVTALHAGRYTVTVTVAEDDENYAANDPLEINFEITKKAVNVTAKSGDWNKTFNARPTATEYQLGYEQDNLIGSDSWTNGPTSYTYTYNVDGKETVLPDTDDAWEALEADTVITVTPAGATATDDYEVVHIPGTLTVKELTFTEDEQLYVPDIAPMTYTGSQLKPQVKVYLIKNGEYIELTSKDYKVTYGENKNAGTGTVKITGKGNYAEEITKPFTIEKASIGNGSENTALGITLKYMDQSLDTKASKLVTSLKYKKALKEGTDFTVTLTKADAPDGTAPVSKTEGTTPAKTPTGTDKAGAYTLMIKPMDNSNYIGYIEKTVYIAGKEKLLKNAKITLKKKSLKWDDKNKADYGNYDKDNWGGFYLVPGTSKTDAKDFIVTMGKDCLTNNQTSTAKDDKSQYFISYTNNDQAGTATITVTGDGINYIGTKSATFKIQGTAFKAGTKAGNIKLPDTLTAPEAYTGKEITKELSSLEIVGKTDGTKLTKDVDYAVTHNNNVKKGNATVIITAKPESGYTGSIKKTFKIQAADLKKAIKSASGGNAELKSGTEGSITGIEYKDLVPYSKSGATISGLVFKNEAGKALKIGTDYTVKYTYTDKKDKKVGSSAKMTLKGKGNYSGTVDVEFTIGKAAYSDLEVSVAPVKLGKKALKPKVTVKDGKKALTVSEDGKKEVKVTYANNEPEKVEAWLTWLASGSTEETEPAAPTVTIEIVNKDSYAQESPEILTLNVYKDKLGKKLTINWSGTANFTYNNGEQVKPEITSITYDSKTYMVKTVGKDYYACDGNDVKIFKITYGANNKSGKKAGSVTIEGLKLYGGKYTERFEIKPKNINND